MESMENNNSHGNDKLYTGFMSCHDSHIRFKVSIELYGDL